MLLLQSLILFTIFSTYYCKIHQASISFYQFAPSNTIYLTKMKFKKGTAKIILQTQLNGLPFSFTNKIAFSVLKQSPRIETYKGNCKVDTLMNFVHPLDVSGRPTITEYQLQIKQPQTLYFQFRDCNFSFSKQYSNYELSLNVKLSIYNNGSHLNSDQSAWYLFIMIFIMSVWLLMKTKVFKFQMTDIDYPKIVLSVCLLSNTIGLLCKSLNYIALEYYDDYFMSLELLYLGMYAVSETVLIFLIVLIGYGWSINFSNDHNIMNYLPWGNRFQYIGFIIGIFNCLMIMVNKINDEVPNKYHMYDSKLGTITVLLRVGILLIYILGIIRTYKKNRDIRQKQFFIKFGLCGSFYLLSLPTLIVITQNLIWVSYQKEFLVISIEILKLVSNIILWEIIGSEKSHYAKICYNNMSFFSPKTLQLF